MMYDVTALGEALIDFTYNGISADGQKLFEQNPGGAPANMLASLNKCGKKTAFIGKVGNDMHGQFLKETLEGAGIDTKGLVLGDDVFTTLAFVDINEKGERKFSFARKPGADIMLREDEVDLSILQASKILHVGSLSLTDEPSRSTTLYAIEKAKEFGCLISYDPNYRESLWDSVESAIKEMKSVLPYVDMMKLSDEETVLLTGEDTIEGAAAKIIEGGVSLVAVTLGDKGAYVCNKDGGAYANGFKSSVVDTTGAGDSFWGGFVYKMLAAGKVPAEVSIEEACDFALFGNAVASLCVEKRGGIPGIPEFVDSEARYEEGK